MPVRTEHRFPPGLTVPGAAGRRVTPAGPRGPGAPGGRTAPDPAPSPPRHHARRPAGVARYRPATALPAGGSDGPARQAATGRP